MKIIMRISTELLRHSWLLTFLVVLGFVGLLFPIGAFQYRFFLYGAVLIWAVQLLPSFFLSFPITKGFTLLEKFFEIGCVAVFLLGYSQHSDQQPLLQKAGSVAMAMALVLSSLTMLVSAIELDKLLHNRPPPPWDPLSGAGP